MTDLRPASGKVEWHLTYGCNIAPRVPGGFRCMACNRASFLDEPHTPDMAMADAEEFCRQADALDWHPRVIIIGGEPTMMPNFKEFVQFATDWSKQWVQVFSHGLGAGTQRKLNDLVHIRGAGASVNQETKKPNGAVMEREDHLAWTDDIFVSPADFGHPDREPCYQHASQLCGISVDAEGYAPCALGGMVDGILKVGGRTKRLADLFDPAKMEDLTKRLCKHCGQQITLIRPNWVSREQVDACEKKFGTPMSPSWIKAFEGRR